MLRACSVEEHGGGRRRVVLSAGVAFPLAMTAAGEAARAQARFRLAHEADPLHRSLRRRRRCRHHRAAPRRGAAAPFGQSVFVLNRRARAASSARSCAAGAGRRLHAGDRHHRHALCLAADGGKPSMLADFTPVGLLSTVPMIVDVPANSRFKSWAELWPRPRLRPARSASAMPATARPTTPTSCACRRTRGAPSPSCPIAARASA